MLQGVVMDLYGQFVDMVAAGRHMDPARVRTLGDGRPYTGHQALGLGLIDQIGTERDARQWLAQNRHLSADLPVETLRRKPSEGWGRLHLLGLASGLGAAAAQGALNVAAGGSLTKTYATQGLALDGALSLWQP
jgi:protease-4